MIDIESKMKDLAKKLNSTCAWNKKEAQYIISKLKHGVVYDISYIVLRRRFMLENIVTGEIIFIKRRNAVVVFFNTDKGGD